MAEYEISQGVSNDLGGIDSTSCAVIVIDETGDPEGSPLEEVLLEPTLRTAAILSAAREHGVPVIFTNDAHIRGIDRELELWGEHGVAGTVEAQSSPQLHQQEEDFEIHKPRYSAFFQTQLRLLLDELGVSTVILCGFDTNICVVHTAADAFFNGFDIVVVEDATATFLIGDQESGLEYMNRCYAAKIAKSDDVIGLIEACSAA